MNIFKKLWIIYLKATYRTCGEATLLMAKEECAKLTKDERSKLQRHMSRCTYCNAYKHQHEFIAKNMDVMKHNVEVDKYLYFLTPEQKERLKTGIKLSDSE